MRNADVEVTNRCNAYCNFCPRDKMPALGSMSAGIFDHVLERFLTHSEPVTVYFCGFGEPLLNPELPSFVRKASEAGLPTGMTTNASLLTPERTAELIDAGLNRIVFSVSDLGDDYEEVYNLDFARTSSNVDHFLEENVRRGSPVQPWLSLVEHDINRKKVKGYEQYWRSKGIEHFFKSAEQNRGGALNRGYLFQGTDKYTAEAHSILEGAGMPIVCPLPFYTISIDWGGQYLLCCQDWVKRLPLGHVTEESVSDIDRIKREQLIGGNCVCRDCSVNPINLIREQLLEMDTPDVNDPSFGRTVEELKAGTRTVQHILDALTP
jgi:MoaA/NifB/PqqE/SkfB family radical SAM enzyme